MTIRISRLRPCRGFHVAALATAVAGLFALIATPAQAVPRQITGGETRLEVNQATFVEMLADGIFATPIAPATLVFGANPAAIFPVAPPGAVDTENTLSAVVHQGGLRLEKQSIGMALDTTNYTIQCTALTSCRLLATANQALPNEVAEIANPVLTDNEEGTITITGIAQLSAATALVLNTLFQTDIFHEGFQLGLIRSTLSYDVPTDAAAYVRPKGASPLRASLVPAYQACAAPNSTHGAPLEHPSCNPPQQSSPNLTVGTPDANGAPVSSFASVLYRVQVGNPSNMTDDADVRIDVRASDVRSAGDLSDYVGELQMIVQARITDRLNSLAPPIFPANMTGTVQDTPLSVTVPCAATASATTGGVCSVATTADSVVPGIAVEDSRSVWELDKVTLFDGGPDGDAETPDNSLFATQGVFVP
jgi:hypothetical protein